MGESVVPQEGVYLSTGWESDVPAGDTLKRQAVLAMASWPVAIAQALGRPWRRTERWAGGFVGDSGELTNPVVLTRPLLEAEAGEVVAEVGTLVPPSVPYFLLGPWPSPDLRRHGLLLLGHPPLMLRFPAPRPSVDPDDVRVQEVTDARTLAVAEQVLIEGYPMPDAAPGTVLAPPLLDGTTRVWLGYVDERPVAVAAAFQAAGATLVEYVAVLPSARGRRAGAAVTWAATLCDATAPALLVASDDGRPVYEQLGFLALERWTAWLRPPRTTEKPE